MPLPSFRNNAKLLIVLLVIASVAGGYMYWRTLNSSVETISPPAPLPPKEPAAPLAGQLWTNGCLSITDGHNLCFKPFVHKNLTIGASILFDDKKLYSRHFSPGNHTRICLNEQDMVTLTPFKPFAALIKNYLEEEGDFLSACLEVTGVTVTEKEAKGCGESHLAAICWTKQGCMFEHHADFGCFSIGYENYL